MARAGGAGGSDDPNCRYHPQRPPGPFMKDRALISLRCEVKVLSFAFSIA